MMCARGVVCAAALLATLLVAAHELADYDDSDDAAYMIVLEHTDGRQCAASLVSIRTGVTTARCARGVDATPVREVWALAAALLSGRPPAPPAAAARRVTRVAFAGDGRDLADPALDIAVVEMEAPFGTEAHARPILMATTRGGCEDVTECYAIRALSAPVSDGGTKRARFRVVNLSLASDKRCAALVPHWIASHARLLCLTGDELCERDMGGGVVCGGKLCGVLSVTANEDGAAQCGETYAAQNIARWRSFLHCAHTLRLCGRGSCSEQCSEQLLDEKEDPTIMALTNITLPFEFPPGTRAYSALIQSSRASRTTTSPSVTTASLDVSIDDTISQPPLEFEPNRADFKAAPFRTSRPGLKAGEYGDNAAEYGADEAPPAPSPAPTPPARPSRTPTASAPLPPPPLAPSAPLAPALHAPAPEPEPLDSTSACSIFNSASIFRTLIYFVIFILFGY